MKWSLSLLSPLLLLSIEVLHPCLAATVAVHDGSWQPDYVLVATEQDVTIGCQQRTSVVFNGTIPGPPIYLTEGKTTWVRVYNQMPNRNFTTHWHGLTMRVSPFADGTPLVSQWPIAPGQFFDYEIHPEPGDAGTYFYHSHVGFQALTAHGALIVEDAATPPYQYDADVPIMIGDFYNKSDDTIVAGLQAIPFQWSGEPNAVIFNDRTGTASFDDDVDDSCKPYVINVEPGKTYRFRFVGATALSYPQIGIEGHSNLTIINADGTYTKPVVTDHIQLGAGQRYDALVTTKTQEELEAEGRDQYWIRFETRGRPTDLAGYALLQYDRNTTSKVKRGGRQHIIGGGRPSKSPGRNPDEPPVTLPLDADLPKWLEYTLESLCPQDFPSLGEVTRTVYITVSQDIINGSYVNNSVTGSLVWEQNQLAWTERDADVRNYPPYLIQAYVTGQTPDYDAAIKNNGWDPETKAFPAKVGEVLDIVWLSNSGPTGGYDYHPMHAHGEHYFDLGSGPGTYDAVANDAHFRGYTPARRDTTMLNRYESKGAANTTDGWRAWRIRVTEDNVGAWMMHCHILQHMVMGMQTVWVFGDAASIVREIPQPYVAGYLEYGGSAYGSDDNDPVVMEFFDQE